jgi:hypothetical protein
MFAWISPALALQLFGFKAITPLADANLISRLFGVRDFLLGSSLLYQWRNN